MSVKTKVVQMKPKSGKSDPSSKLVIANIDKFPHLKNVQESISVLKNYCGRLEMRKDYAKTGYAGMTEPEKNDVEILLIETDIKISKAHKSIDERTQYFQDYHNKLVERYSDVTANFSELRKKAIMLSNDKTFHAAKELKHELDEANNFASKFETNWELKFRHFLELTNIINSTPATEETSDLKDVSVKVD